MFKNCSVYLFLLIPIALSVSIAETQYGYQNPILSAPTNSPENLYNLNTNSSSIEETQACKTQNDKNPSSNSRSYYVYDPITRNCYLVNSNGPCQENMKFYSRNDDRNYGFCDCDQNIPAVYSEETGSCHVLFQTEYCESGFWLLYDINHGLMCVKNNCPEPDTNNGRDFYVLYRGKCVKLGENCGSNRAIQFTPGKYDPVCAEGTVGASAVGSSLPVVKCSSGSRWSALTNKCQQMVGFDLS